MTTLALKHSIIETLKELSPNKMKVALDYLEYLREKDAEWDATAEILANKKLLKDIQVARSDWKKGKKANFVAWRNICKTKHV
ncbi:MAG: hypothetical protein WCW27_06690 [Patescibacteria group bacterium]|jgi:hypothetical protein